MTKNHQFTIGWISPLPLEREAARLVLDEEYPQEEVQYQSAFYLGGRIGKHEVVMGVQRKMGLSQAAILAEKMRAGFPNIKYFVLVGIAGGVPRYGPAGAASELVLGDVVVSSPRGNHGGVLQYDKGAWKGQGRLNFRGHTNGVPGDLMAAVNNFRAEGWSKTNIPEVLKQMRLKLDEKRRHQYDDPGPSRDRLFEDGYEHQGTELVDCKECCDPDFTISRSDRGDGATRLLDDPAVHFGNIASSNQLQISAAERNRVQQEYEAICFEMEAAGVLEEYSCVVVRGICDYADSHKNKGWQNYAAATAAACAKGLLSMIPAIDAPSKTKSGESSNITETRDGASAAAMAFNNGPIRAQVFQQGSGNAGRDINHGNVTNQSAGRSSRNDINIERRLQLDGSGATLSLELEDDDADIKSFVDSGYGTTSETSSVYFIANAPGAREDLLALLLQDKELQVLFTSAFDKVSAPKFEHSFRIMLGQFARELRNEARDKRERSVAYVVRTVAGYVSNCICKKYSIETDMRSKEMDQLSSQLPHKRQLLERLLNPELTDAEEIHNEENSEDQGHEAEEDNWDENDMVSLPHLEQLEKFVISSQAMSNLRRNLRNWINPQPQHSHPPERDQVTTKELLEMQELDEQEQTIAYQMSDTHDQDQPSWWRLKNLLKRFMRPSVPMGYRRLEWTCDCGKEMYGDYDNQDPVAVEELASVLQRRPSVTKPIKKDGITPGTDSEEDIPGYRHTSHNSGGGGGGGGGSGAHYSGTPSSTGIEQSSSTQAAASNQAGSTGTKDSASDIQSSLEASSGTPLHPTARKRKFLELCVNTGEIDISLGEIDITGVNSDVELFTRIYERYKDLRGHRMRRIFLKPVDVHFVHFSVQGRYRVGIYGQPLVIPPEDEVKAGRYHYEECPLKVQPPMDYRTFLHYMNTHKHGDRANPAGISVHTDSIFLRRLPKKTGMSILTGQQSALQFGWGVHIIEGPNKVALSWTTFLSLALSFVVSALYSHFWHTQEQGFGIGQWMVAVFSAAMAALYFYWAET